MGIKERRRRQRETLRSGIPAAAREIASAEGWRAVTIRKIAAAVEYSPPVIYEYFESKEDLLLELVREGYAGQLRAVEKARNSSDDPEEALLVMARAWCRFAFQEVLETHRRELPSPEPGQVLVRVEAAGVAFSEVQMLKGRYFGQPEFPFAPGSTFPGTRAG